MPNVESRAIVFSREGQQALQAENKKGLSDSEDLPSAQDDNFAELISVVVTLGYLKEVVNKLGRNLGSDQGWDNNNVDGVCQVSKL